MNLEANTPARSDESSTDVTSEASLEDTNVSERLYQLAETIGASKTIQAPWGSGLSSWMLPRAMSRICPKVCWRP